MVVRKFKIAKTKRPAGVPLDLDLSWCKKGIVYNIYQCCKCIYEHENDLKRKPRTKMIKEGKKKKQIPICTDHRQELLIKYKKCNCDQEYWGFSLKGGPTCKTCSTYSLSNFKKLIKKWYRLGEFITESREDLSDLNKWNCKHRSLCLECTWQDGSRKAIACKKCPHYIKEGL